MHIYLVTNLVNGKMYVGQTIQSVERRWRKHLSNAKGGQQDRLYQAIRKYGPAAFVAERLTQCDSINQMNNLEKLWITLLGTYNYESGYNMTPGGDGHPLPCTEETRKKMRASALKRPPISQATKDAIGLAHRGKPKPLSQRQKIADAWTDSRRSMQAAVARQVNATENKKLKDYTCPTCNKTFTQVTKGVYGGHRKACLYWNSSTLIQ